MARDVPHRVLIVLLGAIGDVTRALPLLCRLKRAYQHCEFYWAIEPPAAPLLEHHPALSGTVRFDRPRGVAALPPFLRQLRTLRPDWCLDLQRHLKSGLVSVASGAPRRVGFSRRNSREGNFLFHTERVAPVKQLSSKLDQFMCFADHLGVPQAPVEFGLSILPEEAGAVARMLGGMRSPFAVFFLGSTAESRLWFASGTARVAELLDRRGVGVVLVGGPGEEHLAEAVRAATPVPMLNLVGRIGLRHLIGIFARAHVAFGPDCGPMHIAAAVGTPVVSVWGATSPRRSAPYGSSGLVIEGQAPCRPCYRKRCAIGRVCMEHITPEVVIAQLDRALAAARVPPGSPASCDFAI